MKKWLAIPILAIAGMLVGVTGAHAQYTGSCPSVEFIASTAVSLTASLTLPGSGTANAGCANISIDFVSALLYDSTETCFQNFSITQGATTPVYQDAFSTKTDSLDDESARLKPLAPTPYFVFAGHSGSITAFSGHCANSGEYITEWYHYTN